ncbi:MAG: hypothetical protein ACYC1D_02340 [Acidimicrobiales bacterium]
MSPRAGGPLPQGRYRIVVTETSGQAPEVIFDEQGDAFIAGVASLTGTRINATTDHDGLPVLQHRLVDYITDAVEHPPPGTTQRG